MTRIKRVYEQIREKIEADVLQLAPGEYLPSEMQYARTLDVSRLTVRKAVDDLVSAGLVQRIPGKGLMVIDKSEAPQKRRLLLSLPFVTCDAEFFQTMMGCIDAANRLNYDYKILAFTDVKERLRLMEREDLSQYCGAVITCYESSEDARVVELLNSAHVPFIVNGNVTAHPCIDSDDYNGGYVMAEYLLQKGHRDILYITTDRPVRSVLQREAGFMQAHLDRGLEVRRQYILTVADPGVPLLPQDADQRQLPPEAEAFLSGRIPFTALCGYSTLPVLSMLNRLYARGFRVPDDISVMGYGSLPYFPAQQMPLTAVLSPTHEQGARSVEVLHDYLTGVTKEIASAMLPITFSKQKSVRTLHPGA